MKARTLSGTVVSPDRTFASNRTCAYYPAGPH